MRDTIISFEQRCNYVLHHRFVLWKLCITAFSTCSTCSIKVTVCSIRYLNSRSNRVAFSAGYLVTNAISFLLVSIRVALQFLFEQRNKQM